MARENGRGRPAGCPSWCDLGHGIHLGEEDTVHVSRQLSVRNVLLRLCSSQDPTTGELDGPYVLMNAEEFTLDEVDALTTALNRLTEQARGDQPARYLSRHGAS